MKALLRRNFSVLNAAARAGQQADIDTRLRFRFQSAQIAGRCGDLITRMYHLGGADGIGRGNVIARTFCDIHTGRTHVANNPNAVGRNVGNVLLGGANADNLI